MTETENKFEPEFNFSDVTILQADGEYQEVKKIMEKELRKDATWMLRSDLTIDFPTGSCVMVLHFYDNGNIYITDYKSSVSDVFYNPDIPCLSIWAQENGWNVPQPHPDMIKAGLDFWKHFWDTRIIDSDYFDTRYGERQIIDSVDIEDEDEDEDL